MLIFIKTYLSKPTLEQDVESQPNRWSRGGGLEQPCQYEILCGRLISQKLTEIFQDSQIPYEVRKGPCFDSLW